MTLRLWMFWLMTVVAPAATPLRFSGSHVLVDGVYLNGKGPFRFLLDTGGQTSVISSEVTAEVGFVPQFRVELVSVTGSAVVPAGRLEEVALDSVLARGVEVSVSDLTGLKGVDGSAVGVLGQSFLSRFRHRIDYRQRLLAFEEDPARIEGHRVGVTAAGGRPVVSTGVGSLVLDSGAAALTLFRKAPAGGVPAALGTLAGGSRQVERGVVPRVDIGGVRLRQVPAVFCDGAGSEVDGLLATHLFEALYFDPMGRYVVLNARVSRASEYPADASSSGGGSRATVRGTGE